MRLLRRILDIGLPLTGVVIILSAVLFMQEIRSQIAVVLAGIILIEAGVWKLAHQLLPNERKFHNLRTEIDLFISLCRKLNDSALQLRSEDTESNQQDFDTTKNDLQDCLDRIVEVAGKSENDMKQLTHNVNS